MTGPNLLEHEKDIKDLEQLVEDLQERTALKMEETQSQFTTITSQLAELGQQFSRISSQLLTESAQAKEERIGMNSQIQKLFEITKSQAEQLQPLINQHKQVCHETQTTTNTSSTQTTLIPNTQFGDNTQTTDVTTPLLPTPPHNSTTQKLKEPHQTTTPKVTQPDYKAPPFIPQNNFNYNKIHNIQGPLPHTHQLNGHNNSWNAGLSQGTNSGSWYSQDQYASRPPILPQYKFPKMDFPKFEGKHPRNWVSKAEKFFMLNPNLDQFTKVIYAALYLEGEADHWYHTLQMGTQGLGRILSNCC